MLATANTGEIRNAGEWTGRVEIRKEEIPGIKHSMYGLLQASKGERLSSVFSPDGTLISASAVPHCGGGQTSSTQTDQFHCKCLTAGIQWVDLTLEDHHYCKTVRAALC